MTSLVFRSALLSDVASIVALLADDPLGSQRDTPGDPLDDRYILAFNAINTDLNQRLVVASEGDDIVGTLQLSFIPGIARRGAWVGQIKAVRVAAHRRNAGLGHALIEWAIAQCKSRGCSVVQLSTDKSRADAHRFYEKLGFVASHEGYKLSL